LPHPGFGFFHGWWDTRGGGDRDRQPIHRGELLLRPRFLDFQMRAATTAYQGGGGPPPPCGFALRAMSARRLLISIHDYFPSNFGFRDTPTIGFARISVYSFQQIRVLVDHLYGAEMTVLAISRLRRGQYCFFIISLPAAHSTTNRIMEQFDRLHGVRTTISIGLPVLCVGWARRSAVGPIPIGNRSSGHCSQKPRSAA